ncbi:MAG TPA: hypothetical protein VKQ09_00875 [Sphingomonas sp.]|jgi:hypothetical protein|nr:hypothetical protein [Sphingomonas sp.]
MKKTAILALAAFALLAGCGKKNVLKPADGKQLPPKAATSAWRPNVDELLNPGAQARPVRDDELVTKSKPLEPDRFDLPPPG